MDTFCNKSCSVTGFLTFEKAALHRLGREAESVPFRAEARAIFTRLGATNLLQDFERMLM